MDGFAWVLMIGALTVTGVTLFLSFWGVPFSEECRYDVYCGSDQTGFNLKHEGVVTMTYNCVVQRDMNPRVCVINSCSNNYYEYDDCMEAGE